MEKITLDEIRASYRRSGKLQKPSTLRGLLRRISFYPTWLFLRLGLSANQVTAMSFLTGLGGCAMIALGGFFTTLLGIALLQIWVLLDFVDGNVARCRGKCAPLGGFIDHWNVNFIYVLSMTCIGVALFRKPDSFFLTLSQILPNIMQNKSVYLIIGLYTSLTYSLYRWFRMTVDYRWLRASVDSNTPLVKGGTNAASHSLNVLTSAFHRVYTLTDAYHYIFLFLLATILGITSIFLLFLASIHTAYFISYIIYTLRRLKKL